MDSKINSNCSENDYLLMKSNFAEYFLKLYISFRIFSKIDIFSFMDSKINSNCFENDYLMYYNTFGHYEVATQLIYHIYLRRKCMFARTNTQKSFHRIKSWLFVKSRKEEENEDREKGRNQLLVAKRAISRSDCKSIGKFQN